jgi:CRISPR-associated protein Cas4
MGGDEELVHALPQALGKAAHEAIDNKRYGSCKDEMAKLSVYSDELGVFGNIDIYKSSEKLLIERKYKLETIYRGQIYQLWAQYFCMLEMGYQVEKLAFYAISTNKTFLVETPTNEDKNELLNFILKFKSFNPENDIVINQNKCARCIYCNLCDKVDIENVYA